MSDRRLLFRLRINSQLWSVWLVDPSTMPDDHLGLCDYSRRTVEIAAGMAHEQTMDTLTHELIHASCRDLAEDAVLRIESAIGRGLRKAGWVNPNFHGGKKRGEKSSTNRSGATR